MSHFKMPEIKNYGMTTMGERGQVVIPKEIRQKMKLKPGDKFLVFTKAGMVISFIKPEKFDKMISEMSDFTNTLKDLKKK